MSSSEAVDPTIQKSTLPDVKPTTEEAPRKVDGISQLCMCA